MTTRQEYSLHNEKDTKYSRQIVTGGAGFIGSEYVRSSLAGLLYGGRPEKITVLDSLTYAGNLRRLNQTKDHAGFNFIHSDVRDKAVLNSIAPLHDAIIHFAAESHVDRSIESSEPFILSNVVGTNVILEVARKFDLRVVVVSTDEVYGSIASGFANEESILNPSSPYSSSKASADLIARAYHITHGLNVSITRSVNNYGIFQDPEKFIPKSAQNLSRGNPITLYGDGLNVRDWVHISDHCDAISRVLHLGGNGEIYNVGGVESYSNLEVATMLCNYFGKTSLEVVHTEDRLGHDFRYAVNADKIRSLLGWNPTMRLESTIEEIVQRIDYLND